MITITGKTKPAVNRKVIRHRDFANRLGQACENSPHAPGGRGRQLWLKHELEKSFNIEVSPEGIRKWFAGEARPKPDMMSFVARALQVDEAWLALGNTPTTQTEKKHRNAMASGSVNMVAAQIQISGGSVAFPEDGSDTDLFAIIKGKQETIAVRYAGETHGVFKLSFPLNVQNRLVVAPTHEPTVFRFFRIPADIMEDHGEVKGIYIQIECEFVAERMLAANKEVPEIVDFTKMDGILQTQKSRR